MSNSIKATFVFTFIHGGSQDISGAGDGSTEIIFKHIHTQNQLV